MNTFVIGELAEFDTMPPVLQPFWGMDCVITGPLEIREYHFPHGTQRAMAYEVTAANGEIGPCQPCMLRKKRPPREPTVAWEDVPYFNPTKERLTCL